MQEIRIHGRAGQGSITTATILASAAFKEGNYALAFPNFGAERMGAPLNAFVRLSDQPIRLRNQVVAPDYLLVQDPSLLSGFNVLSGLKEGGSATINTGLLPGELKLLPALAVTVATVPAAAIAEEVLGRADRSNTALLGAFAALTGQISLAALEEAVKDRFNGAAAVNNVEALRRGYAFIKEHPQNIEQLPAVDAKVTPAATAPRLKITVGVVAPPSSSPVNHTGSWRTGKRPVFKQETCTGCDLCAILCPEGTVHQEAKKIYQVDLTYCKGCGICENVCHVKDIVMVEESA